MVCVLASVTFALIAMGTVRAILSGLLMGVVLLGFAGFSVKNSLAFGMQERVEKALVIEANEEAKRQAAEAMNQSALGRQERHLSWLRDQYKEAPRNSRERRDLRAEINAASLETVTVQHSTVEHVMGDPEAEMLAKKLGWTIDDYIFANQLALALLLVVGKMLGFGVAAGMWPSRPVPMHAGTSQLGETAPAAEAMVIEDASTKTVSAQDGKTVAPATVETGSGHAPGETVTSDQLDLIPDLQALNRPERVRRSTSRQEFRSLDRERRVRAVKRFVAETMVPSSTRDGITADTFHQHYALWARDHVPKCAMSQKDLGTICGEIEIAKAVHRGRVCYALRPAQEPSSMAKAA